MNDIINILNQVRIVSRKIKEQRKEKFERGENYNTVSYTHLTLPTILLV